MKEKIDEFIALRDQTKKLITDFPAESRLLTLFDQWSLKDIVAHLSNWMFHDIECLQSFLSGVEPYWEPDVNGFNLKGILVRKNMSWNEAFDEFMDLGKKLEKIYKNFPEHRWDELIWKKHSETARKFIDEDIAHLKDEHLGDLKQKLELVIKDKV